MKKAMKALLVLGLSLGMCGCQSTTTANSQTNEETVLADAQELMNTWLEASDDEDYDTFESCFYNTDDDTIDEFYQMDLDYSEYENMNSTLVYTDEDNSNYVVSYTFYDVDGEYPDYHVDDQAAVVLVHEKDGEIYFDFNEEDIDKTNESFSKDNSIYDEGLIEASEANRNYTLGQPGNFMYLDHKTYENALEVQQKYAWVDEDDDLHIVLWFANGTDDDLDVYDVDVSMTNKETEEEIYDFSTTIEETIEAGESFTKEYVFDSDDIDIDTDTDWGECSLHVNSDNEYA